MKITNYSIVLCLFSILLLSFSCKNDDDEPQEDNNPLDITASCCKIPHLEACVGGAMLFLPNAFTPNLDGLNDIFKPFIGQGIEEIESFRIFKADGSLAFESLNFLPNNNVVIDGWDGVLPDGTKVDGIYSYTIVVKNIRGETESFDGEVCCRVATDKPCVDFEEHCAYGTQHNGLGEFDPFQQTNEACE